MADLLQRLFDRLWRPLSGNPAFPLDLAVEHAGPVLPIPATRPRAPAVFQLLDDQQTTIRIANKDGAGNPVTFAAPPTWSVDAALVKLAPSADGTSCQVAAVPGAGLGTCTITARAADGRPIGAVAFTIAADYATVGLEVDPPGPVAPATPAAPA